MRLLAFKCAVPGWDFSLRGGFMKSCEAKEVTCTNMWHPQIHPHTLYHTNWWGEVGGGGSAKK
jgi:hypothetical protein